ncbi:hydroxyacid dehydrogenase [Streptomyces sp. SBST2-5]|uniref:Hydroxyacid dehydrogenase n=1 Tax=Streptomyces composti TaxID=2720025 RepID=A0ABX1A6A8_9ACTN|nr:hydroxyacid dehydrogenase [Streptomyces composti]
MRAGIARKIFSSRTRARMREVVDVDFDVCLDSFDRASALSALAEAHILLTGWGAPRVDADVLRHAPELAAVAHAGGSVKAHLDRACWERGIAVSTAAGVNAQPVAEYTLAMILLAGKKVHPIWRRYQERREHIDLLEEFPGIGNHQRRVGIIGLSRIGRRVVELLRPFDLVLAAYDPYLDDEEAAKLGLLRMSLDELMSWADTVTLHAPALPETRQMIDARRLALLPDGATVINTARGWLVDHDALLAELSAGRLDAVLDVTEPDVPPSDSPLYRLPNVTLTPHLAGAMGNELYRLGDWVADEVGRFARGLPFAAPVSLEDLARMA